MIDEFEFQVTFRPVDRGNRDQKLEIEIWVIAQGFERSMQICDTNSCVQVATIVPVGIFGNLRQCRPDRRMQFVARKLRLAGSLKKYFSGCQGSAFVNRPVKHPHLPRHQIGHRQKDHE